MKKNNMMRIASVLLVAVMLTSCVIAGTFAKYVSTRTVTDSARVAYWGFDKDSKLTFDLFSTSYDVGSADATVTSADTDNVIAPGTSQETEFSFAYVANAQDAVAAPEVDYTFKVETTITGDYDSLDANENFVWTLDGTEYTSVAALKAAIEALDGDEDFEAGELPEGFEVGDKHTIGWAWEYSVDEDGDTADTAMGNMDPLENISITITVTATQID